MDETKTPWTPGPWGFDAGDIGEDTSETYCVVHHGDLTIADVNDQFDRAQGHANGRLMAAAPQLAALLDLALAEIVLMRATFNVPAIEHTAAPSDDHFYEPYTLARKLLAKLQESPNG